ncbi:hypothetical protein DEJ21_14085 [Curtobacterium sp. MCSS17_006]|uniref:hypothetical protein n=1 Tax=Curtobacterium sp. MCSS17_006 TaxID=2175642 RepID=UPI000DAA5785|nr:hypothetical protein [Curtobacterium sp. MCSS17_006]PZE33974.1 hypothetical protein DEJ21_14085 [Curtobacterium sp. MCSS17_006]
MTEQQQYRVIADRDKGDDPQWVDVKARDRYTADAAGRPSDDDTVVRIERPVPTTVVIHELVGLPLPPDEPSSLPTREQIAEVIQRADQTARWGENRYEVQADAVLALLQKGADRG